MLQFLVLSVCVTEGGGGGGSGGDVCRQVQKTNCERVKSHSLPDYRGRDSICIDIGRESERCFIRGSDAVLTPEAVDIGS